jgi:sugar lactone lactonase YvrE
MGLRPTMAAEARDIVVDDTMVFPESMSSLPDGTIFIGSAKGIVFRALPGESHAKAWIKPTPENGLHTLLGVLADDKSNTLWTCTLPSAFGGPPSTEPSALMAFDLKTGKRKDAYPFPPPASVCNDLTIAKDGTVYVSDTRNGRVFTLKPGATSLVLFAEDDKLKGIEAVVFSGDGTLYADNVTKNTLLRIDFKPDGSAGDITELKLSQPIAGPDGFRLIKGNRFVLAEGNGGKLDEVTINGDSADIKVLKDGLVSPAATTPLGDTAYVIEGKIGYLVDPKLKGKDPGPFKALAVPLGD